MWAAGVQANPLVRELGLPVDDRGRVHVDDHLRVEGLEHVWALGDCAAVPNEATPGEFDPATCQHALRQARRRVQNLRGRAAYRYRTLGQVASLGRHHRHRAAPRRAPPRALTAGSWRAPTTCSSCRRRRGTRVVADWITSGLFRRDIAELTALSAIGATEVHRA